jgi:hypothetical protein
LTQRERERLKWKRNKSGGESEKCMSSNFEQAKKKYPSSLLWGGEVFGDAQRWLGGEAISKSVSTPITGLGKCGECDDRGVCKARNEVFFFIQRIMIRAENAEHKHVNDTANTRWGFERCHQYRSCVPGDDNILHVHTAREDTRKYCNSTGTVIDRQLGEIKVKSGDVSDAYVMPSRANPEPPPCP